MLLAIISDVHNNEVNLGKVLSYCNTNGIDTIICCGDLASHETLDFLADRYKGTVHYTFGNLDNDQLKNFEFTGKYKNISLYPKHGELEIGGKKIAFVHFPDKARKLSESQKYDLVFYGHTHKPWTERIGRCQMLNPGNVAGEIFLPTFAIWNTEDDNFTLIRVHDLK